MSKLIASAMPSSSHSTCVPATPAAGPDSIIWTGRLASCRQIIHSAIGLHDHEGAAAALVARASLERVEIAAHAWPDIGVHGNRRTAFELAIFARDLVARRDIEPRRYLGENVRHPLLVLGITVGMQEQDGDRLDVRRVQATGRERGPACSLNGIRTSPWASMRSSISKHSSAGISGSMLAEIEVERIRPVDATDLVAVAKALGGDQTRYGRLFAPAPR